MADDGIQKEKIALALSGGGSRAMAFHLGCLRALNQLGILQRIEIISAVSGGSVIASMYCTLDGDFEDFEAEARKVLAQGFAKPAIKKAFTSLEGLRTLACFMVLLCASTVGYLRRLFRWGLSFLGFRHSPRKFTLRRFASRTTILRAVFSDLFRHKRLAELRDDRPKLIVVACELRSKSAFYFAKDVMGSWRLGKSPAGNTEVAHAVAASAAYPGFLPALDEDLELEKDGRRKSERLILTDGGVYDNLGLAPLWPDRDKAISLHADKYDIMIACRAGYAAELSPAPRFWSTRMLAVIDVIHGRVQNASMGRLFDLKKAGVIRGFIIPYLGQADKNLAFPPPDLVTGESVSNYPTDFSAMSEEWIDRLSKRGEQLTLATLQEHLPHLLQTEGGI
jgi:NTE family protein